MTKCSARKCTREVEGGCRRCPACRQRNAKARLKCKAKYLQRGSCGCGREREDGFRRCLACKQSVAKAARKCKAKYLQRGLCQCGRAKLDGYSQCQGCHTKRLGQDRRRDGYMSAKHLHIASTTLGLKVGASVNPARRMHELRARTFANEPCDVKLLKTYDLRAI